MITDESSGAAERTQPGSDHEITVEAPSTQLPDIGHARPCRRSSIPPPAIIADAGRNAGFAWEEFFQGEIANAHTRKNYVHAVRKFLAWAEAKDVELLDITPGLVGTYFQELDVAVPTKKLHLAALRKFFDRHGHPPRHLHQPGRHRARRALFHGGRQNAGDPAQAGRNAHQVDRDHLR